ncbi:TorF family putative porin [Maricaulis parjimensis]|uniref:TorF family putative porin n=1 Tax=Maricaulis parjimensis TaxID=144023 RepID=UPI0019392BF9|nr:TorF family putative porin [Maricaulis parjimensis]
MKAKILTLALAAAAAMSAPAFAQIEGNIAIGSNYVFRGISQTGDGPAVSGGFDVATESGLYGGVWASSVDFSDDTTLEMDFYAGYGWEAGGFGFDTGVIYYAYPDSPDGQNFVEIYGDLSRSFGPVAWDIDIAYSPEFYGEIGEGLYVSTGAAIELGPVSLDARVGASRFDDLPAADYEDYQIGVSGTVFENVGWDLRYFKASDGGDDGFFVTFSQSFGG